ncbi:MAG TPA: bifunctional 5,10-methylene-tetrahydrofolate dehydrogenase/5,10-methylene-tetrahydrofolate cyclohydrolase, partial [Candidatus Ornithospirochaeta stercorigallinarum]|nr:bifunctional 5,10-methylene-tetrahydrofolate dehydrogenase/5,10-methylene-tetrahydrofolate cyclohydrolase [Candidatus Ornithospirochaeta stercorigallinarum]
RYYGIKTTGRKVVVIGRSNIVGKPMAMLLMQKGADATVTVCNTKTPDLCEFTKDADIIIVATGRPGTLDASMCRDDAVIIDVGVNRISDPSREKGYRLVGDVDYRSFENTSCMVTPVPGGVGLMTVMMLMENTYLAAERRAR